MAINYYNDNRYIAWPILDDKTGVADGTAGTVELLPLSAIVDAGFVCGPHAGFLADTHSIYLHSVYLSSGSLFFDVRSTAPGLADFRLLFSFGENDPDYSTAFAEGELLGDYDGCTYEGIWSGFLTVGDIAETVAALDGDIFEEADARFEPATIQTIGKRVLSINVANQDRTQARPFSDCDEDFGDPVERPVRAVALCLAGPIRFDDGHNVEVQQNDASNTISFAVGAGAGRGVTCEELPTYPAEEPAEPGGLLTGGPRCDEVLASINGVTGKNIRIFSEGGVRIVADPDAHALFIGASSSSSAGCNT